MFPSESVAFNVMMCVPDLVGATLKFVPLPITPSTLSVHTIDVFEGHEHAAGEQVPSCGSVAWPM
jgi:hypothetical protein